MYFSNENARLCTRGAKYFQINKLILELDPSHFIEIFPSGNLFDAKWIALNRITSWMQNIASSSEVAIMPIIIRLDAVLATRKVKSKDLAAAIGITEQSLSLLKQGKVKGVRLDTLEAICQFLECQPGDILEYFPNKTSSDAGEKIA